MVFDILYNDTTSCTHLTLDERHEQLRAAIRPVAQGDASWPIGPKGVVKGRVVPVLPDPGSPFSTPMQTCEEVSDKLQQAADALEEGIVLKSRASKWVPNERARGWVKLKPDYLPTEDLDCLVLGGYYGTGRQGGVVAQWLLGLAERRTTGHHPDRFLTFCRVGTGNSDAETRALNDRLGPHLRKGPRPDWVVATGDSSEKPHLWMDEARFSVVMQVKADVRPIRSKVFATSHSLRFPRVMAIRWDKPWRDVLTQAELREQVQAALGQGGDARDGRVFSQKIDTQHEGGSAGGSNRAPKGVQRLPPNFVFPKLSDVTQASSVLQGMVVHCLHYGEQNKEEVCKWIKAHGGLPVATPTRSATHLVAASPEGVTYRAITAANRRTVYSLKYLQECVHLGSVIPPKPKHRLHYCPADSSPNVPILEMSDQPQDDLDCFGDSFTATVDAEDVRQLLRQPTQGICTEERAVEALISLEPSLSVPADIFRGLHVHLVRLKEDPPTETSAVVREASDATDLTLELLMRLHGARVLSDCLLKDISHFLVGYNATSSSDSMCHKVFEVLMDRPMGKEQVALVKLGWADGRICVLSSSWAMKNIEVEDGIRISEKPFIIPLDAEYMSDLKQNNQGCENTEVEVRPQHNPSEARPKNPRTLRPRRVKSSLADSKPISGIKKVAQSVSKNTVAKRNDVDKSAIALASTDDSPPSEPEFSNWQMKSNTDQHTTSCQSQTRFEAVGTCRTPPHSSTSHMAFSVNHVQGSTHSPITSLQAQVMEPVESLPDTPSVADHDVSGCLEPGKSSVSGGDAGSSFLDSLLDCFLMPTPPKKRKDREADTNSGNEV